MTPGDADRLIDAELRRVIARINERLLYGRRFFITGGTGFFGFWLLSALACLAESGVRLEATVLTRQPQRFLDRYPRFRGLPWLSFVAGDVTSYTAPSGRIDYFIHAATDTSAAAHREPLRIFDTILAGSRRVFEHAVAAGAERVLAISSGAVYGRFPAGVERIAEDAACACDPGDPFNAYGEGKRAMENLAALFGHAHGLKTVVARGFVFGGPTLPLDGHFAIGNFIRDALAGGPVVVNGDGTPLRSYLYGADLAVWLLELLTRGTPGRCYNLGSDEIVSVGELAGIVRDVLAPTAAVKILGAAQGGPRSRYVPDIGRARAELGLAPWTTLSEAIATTAAWHRLAAGDRTC